MSLRERLRAARVKSPFPPREADAAAAGRDAYEDVKAALYARLLKYDLSQVDGDLRPALEGVVAALVDEAGAAGEGALDEHAQARMIQDLLEELQGAGPLWPYIGDPAVTEILVNGIDEVWVERSGRLEETHTRFMDDAHLLRVAQRLVRQAGRRVDSSSPIVDARLPDGSRINVILPPVSLRGPVLCIRRFGQDILGWDDLLRLGSVDRDLADLLTTAVRSRLNLLISGGCGSGKTTLLNVLSACVPDGERIVTIEEVAELRLQNRHTIPLETRPPNVEGRGALGVADLVLNALRMRPDRIIVGEVRGAEAFHMLQAMNTGNPGSMTTVHGNSPRDSLARLEAMVLMAGHDLPHTAIRRQIAAALDLVIQLERAADGSRRIVSVSEVRRLRDDGELELGSVFQFEAGADAQGRLTGAYRASATPPELLGRLQGYGARPWGGVAP